MAIKRLHLVIHGAVQGVYFRDYSKAEALKLGVAGWIQNMSNGTVEAVIEGEDDQVSLMLDWLEVGSPGSEVEKIVAREERPYGETGAFNIRF
jgi:acylphosphatase